MARLALAAQVLIGAETAAQLAVAVAGGTEATFYPQAAAVSLPLFVATVVVFLCWFQRCRANAGILAPGAHRYSAGFAVGGWFIPVATWWIPRRVALDVWRASSPADGTWLINAWWAAWLAKTVGGVVVAQAGAGSCGYSLYDDVVGVVAAVLAILVIQQVTTRQETALRADLGSPSLAQSAT